MTILFRTSAVVIKLRSNFRPI